MTEKNQDDTTGRPWMGSMGLILCASVSPFCPATSRIQTRLICAQLETA